MATTKRLRQQFVSGANESDWSLSVWSAFFFEYDKKPGMDFPKILHHTPEFLEDYIPEKIQFLLQKDVHSL